MASILHDQLQSMALKQYIKQLAPEKLQQLIKNPDISEADLKLIQKNTGNETIKQLATEKLQHLNSQAIQESLNSYRRLHDARGWAASIARAQRINGLKYRYKVLMKKLKFGIFYIMLINLMGHSKWSWMNAYRNRYGLIRDDIHTQKKTLKKSAYWYRKLSDSNELDAD